MSASVNCILTLSCPDRKGVIAAVTAAIADSGGNIVEAAQSVDKASTQFFMRCAFSLAEENFADTRLRLGKIAEAFSMTWALRLAAKRQRVLIMVSKFDHCLNDLLYRHAIGALAMELRAIVSNHTDAERLAHSHGVPYHHLPISADTKKQQENHLCDLVEAENIDLIVLARYMQVLSPELCARMSGRIINIHHSFLPSFKGAKPYHQAFERGVKLIGATAHYVTSDLDEGPIIEQDALRISHELSADDLVAAGRDVEASVLARAVKFHIEDRVLLNGARTVVFR